MTRNEAQSLLEVYRPGGPDAADPRMAEALALARSDPELAEWFAREQAFDAGIRQHLRATPAPANLRTAILAGGKVIERLTWWQLVNWSRVSATALVLAVGAGFFLASLNRTQGILMASREASRIAQARTVHLAMATTDLAHVRAFLAKCHAPADFKVPEGMRKLPLLGCTLVGLQVQTASAICFRISGSIQLTLFVVDGIEDKDTPADGSVKIIEDGDWATAIWSDGKKTYIVRGPVPGESLRRVLI